MSVRMPSLYIPHGGGPCFFMEWTMGPADSWRPLEHWLRTWPRSLDRHPEAILVVSAHWEEDEFTVQTGATPGLLFDYYGFPEHTYRLGYPAPGAPAVAARARALLEDAGIPCREAPDRPFDHGVFIPLLVMYPHANIPVFQLSLKTGLDPAAHLAAGRALSALRDERVLVVGSGMSFHNLPLFMRHDGAEVSAAFDQWLAELPALMPDERARRLVAWGSAPYARGAHPREEHLLPLMVAAGAGFDAPMTRLFSGYVHGHALSAFGFDCQADTGAAAAA